MNTNENTNYTPADDENQGVMTKLMQAEAANGGVSQATYMDPILNQGPEPEKDEVNDSDEDTSGVDENKWLSKDEDDENDLNQDDDE